MTTIRNDIMRMTPEDMASEITSLRLQRRALVAVLKNLISSSHGIQVFSDNSSIFWDADLIRARLLLDKIAEQEEKTDETAD